MKSIHLVRVVSLFALASVALTAQAVRQGNAVPLKNWAAPLYWQPNQAGRGAPGGATPQLVFSANAVSTNALTFVAITPCRLVDTRGVAGGFNGIAPFNGPSIAAAGTLTIPVQSTSEASSNTEPAPCGVIPSIAQGYSLNLTVVPHTGGAVDYISLWPSGATQPFVATLDDPQGAIVSNAAIVPAGTPTGGINVYNAGPATTDVIIDMNGYFAAPTDVNNNTAIGEGALANNTTGFANTASGLGALGANTTGAANTANGSGALINNTTGNNNTASGSGALGDNIIGGNNAAYGFQALLNNTTGSNNTASGAQALYSNTTGSSNTASGGSALRANTTGFSNTANGFDALLSNTTGSANTAVGVSALDFNTTGSGNTATGAAALLYNTTGFQNTASGYQALVSNTTGANNTASGYDALAVNTTGSDNAAIGNWALQLNTTGSFSTAVGLQALSVNTTGSNDIAIGYQAALNVVTGSDNIHIGSQGLAGDTATIKIGTGGTQTSAYIAGISGANVTGGVDVLVNSSGQLGTVLSSGRFKEQITDMGDRSSKLFQLRPVNFFYKPQYDDGTHLLQYGLIAEEVAKVYPEMVAYDNDGQILTVKYQLLAPMLLNEVQKQSAQLQVQQEENRKLEEQNRQQSAENRSLEDRLAALETLLSGQIPTVARARGSQ